TRSRCAPRLPSRLETPAAPASRSPPARPHPTARTACRTAPASATLDNFPNPWSVVHRSIAAAPLPDRRRVAAAAPCGSSAANPPPHRDQIPGVRTDARCLSTAPSGYHPLRGLRGKPRLGFALVGWGFRVAIRSVLPRRRTSLSF